LKELQAKAESVSRLIGNTGTAHTDQISMQGVKWNSKKSNTIMLVNLSPKRKSTGKVLQPKASQMRAGIDDEDPEY